MVQARFDGSPNVALSREELERRITAAIAMGADPEQARRHFEGHPTTDPLTRFSLARVDPRRKGESDLGLAVSLDLTDIAAEKIAQGSDPNYCARDGTTPLMDAAMNRNSRLAGLLLNAGARVNVRNQSGATPLQFAASNGADEVVRLLLKAGADFREPELFTSASYGCSPETLRTLLDLGVDVNESGGKPLLNATAAGNPQNIRFLLDHGASVNARGYKQRTPLIMATRDDNDFFPANLEVVQTLLKHGADVNARDEDGWAALMGAARDGDASVVRLLLENHADVSAIDKEANTPFSLAIKSENSEIIQLIEQHLSP